ncbi:MAG: PTS sugar transporter subunit IIA [Erysipelotrichaceae bacterium]
MSLFSKFMKKDTSDIFITPIQGEVKPISETPDEAFAQKMMGDGIVIFPTSNEVYAPADAKVEFVFPTKHAIGMTSASGLEFLIHVGIDTVKLEGKGFEIFVEPGQNVKAGDLLMKFDLEFIKAEATSIATPVVFTNLDTKTLDIKANGETAAKEVLLSVK